MPKEEKIEPSNPWFWAHEKGNLYLSPEDIKAAIDADGTKLEIWEIVLAALGDKRCEDWSLCAFIAYTYLKDQ